MKKKKNKYLKSLIKSNPTEMSTTITIISLKKNCNS